MKAPLFPKSRVLFASRFRFEYDFMSFSKFLQKVDFNKVLAVQLWAIENSEYKRVDSVKFPLVFIRKIFGCLYRCSLTMPVLHGSSLSERKTFFLRAYSREDLDKHSEFYESAIGNTLVCVLTKRRKGLSFIPFLSAMVLLFRSRKVIVNILNKNEISLISQESSALFLVLLEAFSDVLKIFPHIQSSSRLVSFQEMVPVENLACQLANALGINTYALQHALGAYSEFGTYEARYSKVHYSASVCSCILAWGEYSKKDIKKFTNSKIVLVGKSYLPTLPPFANGVTIIFEADDEINSKLSSIAVDLEGMGIEVSRWYRPGHKLVVNGLTRDGPLRKTVVGWRSSLLVELGFLGATVFVIPESVFTDALPSFFVIDSAKEIQERLYNTFEYPHDVWRFFISCTGDESVCKYRQALLGT